MGWNELDRNKMTKQKGFTLIEVMIALLVLLTGMLGVMSMQYYAVSGNASSREMRVATSLSQQMVENFKVTPYDSIVSGSQASVIPVNEAASSGGVDYTRTWWVLSDCIALALNGDDNTCNPDLAVVCTSDPDNSEVTQTSAIRVRKCWSDRNGAVRSVTLDSLRWDEDA